MTETVIAFDCFGTVFDMSSVPKDQMRAYGEHLRKPEWSPLSLPSEWEFLPAHADAVEGLRRLQKMAFVVTCSNGPMGLLAKISKRVGIHWDAIIPLEMNRVFKPHPRAYMTICEVLECFPGQVLMVTANERFGDLEAAAKVGMVPQLIDREYDRRGEPTPRRADAPKSLIELADLLGC